jgi:hypothetical protein
METSINTLLWQQAGAAIDMLENAITACPDDLWNTDSQFWYIGYHTIFFFDYYLSDSPIEKDYVPPFPFTLSEFGEDMPERVYDKAELLAFLEVGRRKCRDLLKIASLHSSPMGIPNQKRSSSERMMTHSTIHYSHRTGNVPCTRRYKERRHISHILRLAKIA